MVWIADNDVNGKCLQIFFYNGFTSMLIYRALNPIAPEAPRHRAQVPSSENPIQDPNPKTLNHHKWVKVTLGKYRNMHALHIMCDP